MACLERGLAYVVQDDGQIWKFSTLDASRLHASKLLCSIYALVNYMGHSLCLVADCVSSADMHF